MRNEETLRKLMNMKLSGMAEAYARQTEDTTFNELSFDQRLELIVDYEYSKRRSNRIARLRKQACFVNPEAAIEDIEYHPDRHLDKELILELATGTYIQNKRNIILMGASGNGKTWLANAFGMHACRNFYKVRYTRLPDLLDEFVVAKTRADGSYRKLLKKYKSYAVLIIDDWLLTKPNEEQVRLIFEIIESRLGVSSTIFCSQIAPEGWYDQLGPELIADAIMDRIQNNSYQLLLDGTISMRERHGIKGGPRND